MKLFVQLTYTALADDPGQTEEEHHAPDVEETSHLKHQTVGGWTDTGQLT